MRLKAPWWDESTPRTLMLQTTLSGNTNTERRTVCTNKHSYQVRLGAVGEFEFSKQCKFSWIGAKKNKTRKTTKILKVFSYTEQTI